MQPRQKSLQMKRGVLEVECEVCDGAGGRWITDFWIVCDSCSGSGLQPVSDDEPVEDDYSEESYP